MTIKTSVTSATKAQERLPYPANALGEPKKSFDETFRLSTAVKGALAKNK